MVGAAACDHRFVCVSFVLGLLRAMPLLLLLFFFFFNDTATTEIYTLSLHDALPIIDFNRVNGLYLGLSSGGLSDFGPHDEFGVDLGGGYGFESKRWEGLLGLEYRLPIVNWSALRAEHKPRVLYGAATIAIGGELHNQTS